MHGISMCPRPHDLHSIKHTRVVGQKRSHALARVAKSTSPYVYVLALACELTRPPDTLAGERRRDLTAGHAELLGVVL